MFAGTKCKLFEQLHTKLTVCRLVLCSLLASTLNFYLNLNSYKIKYPPCWRQLLIYYTYLEKPFSCQVIILSMPRTAILAILENWIVNSPYDRSTAAFPSECADWIYFEYLIDIFISPVLAETQFFWPINNIIHKFFTHKLPKARTIPLQISSSANAFFALLGNTSVSICILHFALGFCISISIIPIAYSHK